MRTANLPRMAYAIVILSVFVTPSVSRALEGPGSTGASYLTLPVGPKSVAMGEIQGSLTGDPFNWMMAPNSLGNAGTHGVGVSYTELMLDTRLSDISYLQGIGTKLTLAAGFTFLSRPDIQGYDEDGVETKKLQSYDYEAVIGIGYSPVQSVSTGMNIKDFREKLDQWTAGGISFNFGATCKYERAGLLLALVVQNVGPDITFESQKEPLPLTFRVGSSYTFHAVDGNVTGTIAFDLVKPRYEEQYVSVGSELELRKFLALRIGYCGQSSRPGDGLSAGIGIALMERLRLDYAWSSYGDLGSFHRLSLFVPLHTAGTRSALVQSPTSASHDVQ